eukprot:scaffold2457_cov110-Alexandrium_tamarense.AAC.3
MERLSVKWPASVVATGSVMAAVAAVVMMAAAAPAVGVVGLFATSERIADPQPHPAGRPASEGSIPLLLRLSGLVMAAFLWRTWLSNYDIFVVGYDGQAPNHRAHNPKNYYYYMTTMIFFIGLDTPLY